MNTKLKDAMQTLAEMIKLQGEIVKNARSMGPMEDAAKQAAQDLFTQARNQLSVLLQEQGYPETHWGAGESLKNQLAQGNEIGFAQLMAVESNRLRQRLSFNDGNLVFRSAPIDPGDWERIRVTKTPVTTDTVPVATIVWETPPPSRAFTAMAPPFKSDFDPKNPMRGM